MEKNNKTTTAKKTGKTYSSKFLKRNAVKKRGDKFIYVCPEYHQRLMRIAKVVGQGEIPLYAYLDNILKHHFELFSEEIIAEYNESNKSIFKNI